MNLNQKKQYAVADENIRNKLNSDPDYIDMIGYYILHNYQNFPDRDLDYVPDVIQE